MKTDQGGLAGLIDDKPPLAVALIQDGAAVTYGELAVRSRRLAAGLAALGIGRGDRVALWLPNVPEWLEVFFACARIGATVVSVNTRFRSAEIADIVGRSGCRTLILWPGFKGIDFAGILAAVEPAALEAFERVIAVRDGAGREFAGRTALDYSALLAGAPLADEPGGADDPCLVFTTSGTTAKPKFVLHVQGRVRAHGEQVAAGHGYRAEDSCLLQALPYCGAFGHAQAMAALAAGRPSVVQTTFDAADAVRLARLNGVTHFNASDEMIAMMAEETARQGRIATLRCVGYARFSGVAGLLERAEAEGFRLTGLFGMSETHALFARQPLEDEEHRLQPGGVPVIAGAEVRVVDEATGRPLEPGGIGLLEIRSPTAFVRYLDNPEATAAAFTADGFFRTGDLASMTGRGGFVYIGRGGDALRLAGFLVAPAEIEAQLERHPKVAASAVIGGTGSLVGKAVGFVEPVAGERIAEAELQEFCRRDLAAFKVPARIIVLDELPRLASANGAKIQRDRLRRRAAELFGV